ncbi:hypothetical protein AQUSIP_06840 [Aquicella siphonis]|uniref:Uncharacterized protein n=1 Tax=Aquicella siphonis TaxID=254247 RepID=A0A5E4PEX3_9COXI|nr:hypothetical protein [Aquicella siphonis]VVC75394.1 hypothetical protein AQUSIP_06840 [Aquicella siphonis]
MNNRDKKSQEQPKKQRANVKLDSTVSPLGGWFGQFSCHACGTADVEVKGDRAEVSDIDLRLDTARSSRLCLASRIRGRAVLTRRSPSSAQIETDMQLEGVGKTLKTDVDATYTKEVDTKKNLETYNARFRVFEFGNRTDHDLTVEVPVTSTFSPGKNNGSSQS